MALPLESIVPTDVEGMIRTCVKDAVAYAARKSEAGNVSAVRTKLASGDEWAFSYFAYACATNIASSLAQLDDNILEAFVLGLEGDDTNAPCFPVTLVLRVACHTAALECIVSHVERELPKHLEHLGGMTEDASTAFLEIRVVEDEDLAKRRGLGAAVTSIWAPALRVWERK